MMLQGLMKNNQQRQQQQREEQEQKRQQEEEFRRLQQQEQLKGADPETGPNKTGEGTQPVAPQALPKPTPDPASLAEQERNKALFPELSSF
jgi:DNA-binding protein H-NS